MKINNWSVLSKGKYVSGQSLWLCRCVCGIERMVGSRNLRNGLSNSCGCVSRAARPKANLVKKRLRGIHRQMRFRCEMESHPSYKNYGGRGVFVCNEWKNFESFYSWAISNGYSSNSMMDRVDVNGSYRPENCRWVNAIESMNNTRRNVFWDWFGEMLTPRQISQKSGISFTLVHRLSKSRDIHVLLWFYKKYGIPKRGQKIKWLYKKEVQKGLI